MRKPLIAMLSVLIVGALLVTVPNVMTALNRSRQKRTMADIRTLASALEARAVDTKTYAVDIVSHPDRATSVSSREFADLQPVNFDQIEHALVPKYALKLARSDGWGHRLEVRVGEYDTAGRARSYAIRSLGSDRQPDRNTYSKGVIRNFADDIVFIDGSFRRYPEGL